MTYIDPAPEFYSQAGDDDVIGEICTDCRSALYGEDLDDLRAANPNWDAGEYDRSSSAYDVEIHEGSDDAPAARFVYRGLCYLCETWEGGDRWPVILISRPSSSKGSTS